MEVPQLLLRHLDATRHGLKILGDIGKYCEWSNNLAIGGFPGIELTHEIIPIHSHQRRWEYSMINGRPWIVSDLELSVAMGEMRGLLHQPGWKVIASHIFFHPILADAFREALQPWLFSLCVKKSEQKALFLNRLRASARLSPGWSGASVMACLHEMAHLLVNRRDPVACFWEQPVKSMLEKLAEKSEATSVNPSELSEIHLSLNSDPNDLITPHIASQMKQYADRIRGTSDVFNEALCDIIAALAFLNLGTGKNLFYLAPEGFLPISIREFGDALVTAVETLKHLQLLSAVRQFASDAGKSNEVILGDYIIDLTVRSNALVLLLDHIYRIFISQDAFKTSGFNRDLSTQQKESLFIQSVHSRTKLYNERLTTPFEDLTGFYLDHDKTFAEYQQIFGQPPDTSELVPAPEIDLIRENLYKDCI